MNVALDPSHSLSYDQNPGRKANPNLTEPEVCNFIQMDDFSLLFRWSELSSGLSGSP